MERLRGAADGGDAGAARELGRLLSMLRADVDEQVEIDEHTWPEEQWLRAAVQARPDDRVAAVLLAGRLVQQIAHWSKDPDYAEEHGEDEETLERREAEARALYERVLADDPDDPTARVGLATLVAWAHDGEDNTGGDVLDAEPPYWFYSVELGMGSGSFNHSETVITTDLDEARWALARLLAPVLAEVGGPPLGVELHLFVHGNGEVQEVVRLDDHLDRDGRVDWDAVTVPPLTGEPLPPGHPVGVDHYGYSTDWG